MNDASLDMQKPGPPRREVRDEPDTLPLGEVRDLFVVLAKALRAYQLYDENNPVYQRFVSSLGDAFAKLWTLMDRATVQVTEDSLLLGSAEVYRSDSRADSLAFLFFKDGVREITFLPGLEEGEELTRFLSVLLRARKARQDGDDLLTILWEEDLQSFRYKYADLLAEGVDVPVPGGGATGDALQGVLQSEFKEPGEEGDDDTDAVQDGGAGAAEGPKPVSREDFNPTLYSLDPREMEQLQREIEKEMSRDLRADVLSALFDRLEEPDDPGRQSEVLGVFSQLLPNFLSRGALDAATQVLGQLRALEAREGVFDETRRGEVKGLLDELSSPQAMDELIRAVEDGSVRPDPARLGTFLGHLRAGALGPLLRAAETTEIKEVQPVLREAVTGIARRNQATVLTLLGSRDAIVAAGAARLVGRMQITEAGPALADLLRHPAPGVRLAAVEAAVEIKASTAAGALQEVLEDADRDVRIAGARGLGRLRYRPASRLLGDLVQSKEVKGSDLSEKIAFFESYGMLAGDEAVSVLDKMLNGRGFLGRREASDIRACAALGLGKANTAAARKSLQKAMNDDDAVVRSAVNRALRGEEE